MNSTKFAVNDVVPNTCPLPTMDIRKCLSVFPLIEQGQLIATSLTDDERLVDTDWTPKNAYENLPTNGLFHAIHAAFCKHYPLILSPDIIWITILQELSRQVNANPELYRGKLVDFEGKQEVVLNTYEDTPWIDRVNFLPLVQKFMVDKKLAELVKCDFTTSTKTSLEVSQLCFLDITKHYFTFIARTMCGIPSIELKGSTEDWIKLKGKTSAFLSIGGMEEWQRSLSPILDEFINASQNKIDPEFWKSIYKYRSMSGGGIITGWIITLLNCSGLSTVPSSLTSTPFIWIDQMNLGADGTAKKRNMKMHAGLTGVKQHPGTLALEPVISWAITILSEIN